MLKFSLEGEADHAGADRTYHFRSKMLIPGSWSREDVARAAGMLIRDIAAHQGWSRNEIMKMVAAEFAATEVVDDLPEPPSPPLAL